MRYRFHFTETMTTWIDVNAGDRSYDSCKEEAWETMLNMPKEWWDSASLEFDGADTYND